MYYHPTITPTKATLDAFQNSKNSVITFDVSTQFDVPDKNRRSQAAPR